jgi:uncharacterized protein (TIGR00730 family)
MPKIESVCVYCGSSPGHSETYVEAGYRFGRSLASHGLRLVFGGGTRGIMGAVSRGAAEGGGAITGIIPRFLLPKEAPDADPSRGHRIIVTEDMHQRKHAMFENSDAFVALPGGIGTVEEIVEIMTWAQLGRHRKPMVFANVDGFWNPMLAMLDYMRHEGFIHTGQRVQPLVIHSIEDIVPAILAAADKGEAREGNPAIIDRL